MPFLYLSLGSFLFLHVCLTFFTESLYTFCWEFSCHIIFMINLSDTTFLTFCPNLPYCTTISLPAARSDGTRHWSGRPSTMKSSLTLMLARFRDSVFGRLKISSLIRLTSRCTESSTRVTVTSSSRHSSTTHRTWTGKSSSGLVKSQR